MKNTKRGITLIALVITIIVLLILAGISISMLAGDNSILQRAALAKEATRGGEVQDRVRLEVVNNLSSNYLGGAKKDKAQVVSELHTEKKLTDEEVETLQESDIITIGGITIDFSKLKSSGDNSSEVLAYLQKEENFNTETWAQNGGINPEKVSCIAGTYPIIRVRYIDNKLYRISFEMDTVNNKPVFTNAELEENLDAIISVVNGKKQIQTSFGTFTEDDEYYHYNTEYGWYIIENYTDPNGWYQWYYNNDGLLIEIWND